MGGGWSWKVGWGLVGERGVAYWIVRSSCALVPCSPFSAAE